VWAWKMFSAAREKKKANEAEIRLERIEANVGIRDEVVTTANDGIYGSVVQAGAIGVKDAFS
jgi:hypothetical protein